MQEHLCLLYLLIGSAVSVQRPPAKRSLAGGWLSGPPDFSSLPTLAADDNPWRSLRIAPDLLQSSDGWIEAAPRAPPVFITKHVLVEKSVPLSKPLIVERKVAVPVEKLVPVAVEKVVQRPVAVPVPQPVPYPVERLVQVPVRQPVAVAVQQPYPVSVRQGVPYPVPVPVLLTPQGLVLASGLVPSLQSRLQLPTLAINAGLDQSVVAPAPSRLQLPALPPLAIGGVGQAAGVLPEGLSLGDPGLLAVDDNLLTLPELPAEPLPLQARLPVALDASRLANLWKWKRSISEIDEKTSPRRQNE